MEYLFVRPTIRLSLQNDYNIYRQTFYTLVGPYFQCFAPKHRYEIPMVTPSVGTLNIYSR